MKMTQEERKALEGIRIGKENETIRNRFSGVEVSLSPEAVAIYDVIICCEASLNMFSKDEKTVELFYTARDVFRKNWPDEYMILLD